MKIAYLFVLQYLPAQVLCRESKSNPGLAKTKKSRGGMLVKHEIIIQGTPGGSGKFSWHW